MTRQSLVAAGIALMWAFPLAASADPRADAQRQHTIKLMAYAEGAGLCAAFQRLLLLRDDPKFAAGSELVDEFLTSEAARKGYDSSGAMLDACVHVADTHAANRMALGVED